MMADYFIRIKYWDNLYENSRSRIIGQARWVPIPNKHDGEGYSRIMFQDDGLEIFAFWILILQVASKCNPRGSLVRKDGSPLDIPSILMKTRVNLNKQNQLKKTVDLLLQLDWIELVKCKTAMKVSSECQVSAVELNRIELNRIEGKGKEVPPNPLKGDGQKPVKKKRLTEKEKKAIKVESNTLTMKRIGDWYGRRGSLWTLYEEERLKLLEPLNEAEVDVIEIYYMAEIPKKDDIRRKALETLLNNWNIELDRARKFKPPPERDENEPW